MKKIMFLLLSLACFNLEATHFEFLAKVTPTSNENEFLVEVRIEVMDDGETTPTPIGSPKLLCIRGELAEAIIGSEEEGDFIRVQVLVPKDTDSSSALVKCLMVENGIVGSSVASGVIFNLLSP